jgi:imidazolonepropionase-like amidohydrolase
LHNAGVTILPGTDAPNPGTGYGVSMHAELLLLTESGLTPEEALHAATAAAAREFGLIDRGRIEPGRRADLLLVKGDPSKDIRATRDILGVWKAGAEINREEVARVAKASRNSEGKQ